MLTRGWRKYAASGAGTVLLILLLGTVTPWWALHISGDIVATSVTMHLDAPVDVNDAALALDPAKPLYVFELGSIEPAPVGPPVRSATISAGKSVSLSALHLVKGGDLAVRVTKAADTLDLQLLVGSGAGATIELTANGGVAVTDASPPRHSISLAGTHVVTLGTDGTSASPMRLAATIARPVHRAGGEPWAGLLEIRNARVSTLRFGQETGALEGERFSSTIRHGSLTLEATEEKHDLDAATPVMLNDFKGELARLSIEDDGVHVVFSGDASKPRIGADRLLAPSLLDIAYHTRWIFALGAFLTALVAVADLISKWHKMAEGAAQKADEE